jgi:hypothetical protein
MAKILGIGIAALDIINTVDGYPNEDAEVRAINQRVCRGGNATNTLVVLSQLISIQLNCLNQFGKRLSKCAVFEIDPINHL